MEASSWQGLERRSLRPILLSALSGIRTAAWSYSITIEPVASADDIASVRIEPAGSAGSCCWPDYRMTSRLRYMMRRPRPGRDVELHVQEGEKPVCCMVALHQQPIGNDSRPARLAPQPPLMPRTSSLQEFRDW